MQTSKHTKSSCCEGGQGMGAAHQYQVARENRCEDNTLLLNRFGISREMLAAVTPGISEDSSNVLSVSGIEPTGVTAILFQIQNATCWRCYVFKVIPTALLVFGGAVLGGSAKIVKRVLGEFFGKFINKTNGASDVE